MVPTTSQENDDIDGLPLSRSSVGNGTMSDRGQRRRGYTNTGTETLRNDKARRRAASGPILPMQNSTLLEDLAILADTDQPVTLDTFRRGSSVERNSVGNINTPLCSQLRESGSEVVHHVKEPGLSKARDDEDNEGTDNDDDKVIDTELLETYIAYCKSVGHEPNIQVESGGISPEIILHRGSGSTADDVDSYIQERPVVQDHYHFWTKCIGTRYSKRRGCTQFWVWLLIGVGVLLWLGISLSSLQLNEVLHLDAFTVKNVQVTEDYTFLHFLEEVDFHLTYTIETPSPDSRANPNSSYFNALLLNEYEYEHYVDGEPFEYIATGSKLRTTYAYLPNTYIDNTIEETMYFVVQPCYLERNPTVDYCNSTQLPTSVSSSEKIYNLDQKRKMKKNAVWEHFNVTYMSVNPMPVACSSSGWLGGAYLLLFLPYLVITLFGLRVFQMIRHCENWKKNIERIYSRELNVPENEVDYWQPMPWDRKVPKTRLCGPCCWKKFRRPFEPFYTWWRHENYFTWVFCPYRNERLSRGERALIVVCSLYVTFYVLFIIVMLRDSYGSSITILTSVVMYAVLTSILPSAGKAIFKELFKLIFRQRRKYFRAKAAGGDLTGFSFRLAFLLQVLVVILLTLAQAPIFYIWAKRSCLFLKKFIYYGVLSAILRVSLMGVALDFAWYLILQTWGWKDLCPLCTERIAHCDCFNDELLVLAVERVGPKWELIRVLDGLMAKQNNFDPQFGPYTADQLRERWSVIVERAEKHMEKVEKLRAYQEKKRQETLRRGRFRHNFTTFLSLRGSVNQPNSSDVENTENSSEETRDGSLESSIPICSVREKKILELNSKIKLDAFEKHYDSNIADVFHALTRSVMKHRRHNKPRHHTEDRNSDDDDSPRSTLSTRQTSDGETMWVFDTPEQRLQRREEERLQRRRAFRVLNDYYIENVDSSPVTTSSQGSEKERNTSSNKVFHQDPKGVPLLSASNKTNAPRDEEVVVEIPGRTDDVDGDNLDGLVSAQVDDDYSDGVGDSDLERGSNSASTGHHAYTVTEKPKSLLRRVSASATAFAAWCLDYDPKVKY
ncbi:hypothetical protein F441_14778 [Phytophthora nicotianae CJ01A1]|uniref:Transmembrane protein n=1 Tax=Phytophthora nicotianae CJ01A1 TaxID=1317063 RepID=W2WG66_PHYNI|nr:hypothetical protein F441_14778 [Phytophthora nicotianae CJ01A1]